MPLFGEPDISKLEQRRDIKGLIKALKHRKESVRTEAAEALGRMGAEAINPLIGEIRKPPYTKVPTWVAVALAKIGGPAIEPLIRAQAAAASVGNMGLFTKTTMVSGLVLRQLRESAVKPLIGMLSDPDANVRGLVSSSLGALGEPAVEPLIAALEDAKYEVRLGAAAALGQICDSRAIDPLRRALKDENRWVRLHSAGALAKTDPSEGEAIQLLREAAQDHGPDSSDDYRGIAELYLKECGKKP